MSTDSRRPMTCPCCGRKSDSERGACADCGARRVGEPLAPPDVKLPGLGPSFAALAVVLVVALGFFFAWLLGNDLRAARAILVWALGEGNALAALLLKADPDLPRYRIFTFDAYRLAALCSFGAVPLSLLGVWLARRARRLAEVAPLRFGGRRLATASLALSALLCVAFGAAGLSSIPRAVESSRARRAAEVRAEFYRIHNDALARYYKKYGNYPQELSDLRPFLKDGVPQTDYWGNPISYVPTGLIASKDSASVFSNYHLTSAGPDGELGTPDDIRMVDGMIVGKTDDGDLPAGLVTTRKAKKKAEK
jgi:hypothetical protein